MFLISKQAYKTHKTIFVDIKWQSRVIKFCASSKILSGSQAAEGFVVSRHRD